MLSEKAQALYDALPEDGAMLSGGKLRVAVVMSNAEYEDAKRELRASGVVAVGRGRGGTFGRMDAESVETPEASPPKKTTLQERAAIAREVKAAKSTERKRSAALKQALRERARDELEVDIECIMVRGYGGWDRVHGIEPYIEVFDKPGGYGAATLYRFPDIEDWLDEYGSI